MLGIRWFSCAGPLGTFADEVTNESLEMLLAMKCEVILLGGGRDQVGVAV